MMRWSYSNNMCHYSLKRNDIIYAGSALMMKMVVNNPKVSLPRTAIANKWNVVLRGKGLYTSAKSTEPAEFQKFSEGLEATDYGSNVAVVGILSHVSMQPTDFRISEAPVKDATTGGMVVEQEMYVFFKTEQTAGFESSILLQAPVKFNFGAEC